MPDRPDPKWKERRDLMLVLWIPSMMLAYMIGGALVGYALKRWVGLDPWGWLLGFAIAIAAIVKELVRIVHIVNSDH